MGSRQLYSRRLNPIYMDREPNPLKVEKAREIIEAAIKATNDTFHKWRDNGEPIVTKYGGGFITSRLESVLKGNISRPLSTLLGSKSFVHKLNIMVKHDGINITCVNIIRNRYEHYPDYTALVQKVFFDIHYGKLKGDSTPSLAYVKKNGLVDFDRLNMFKFAYNG